MGGNNQATADTLPRFPRATLTLQLDADIKTNVDLAILTPAYTSFAHADNMWVKFKNGNEAPWSLDMKGSRGAANAFAQCMASLPQQPQASQPYDRNTPTQPFDANKTSKNGRDI